VFKSITSILLRWRPSFFTKKNCGDLLTGFSGTLAEKLPAEGKAALRRIGVLTGSGRELMSGCVVFPLVAAPGRQVVSLYGRHTERRQHLYLPGERRGVFNPQGARNTDEVIITESVIDAAALWSAGLRNVIPIYGTTGLTEEIVEHMAECRVKRAVLMMDSDEAGRAAAVEIAAKLREANIEARSVELPAKDPSEFIAQGGTADNVRAIVAPAVIESSEEQAAARPEIETTTDGAATFSLDGREYRVRGLSPNGLERLKVNVRLKVGAAFHLDTIDLYQARARTQFAESAARLCRTGEQQVSADLLQLIEHLEAARLSMRRADTSTDDAPMTGEQREAALEYLRSPNLCERIVEDFRKCGLVGERATVLVAYLAAVSRKLEEPLCLLIVARSGAGKSALQDALCALVPADEVVRVTRVTGQALFYKDPYSLQRKVLAIAEEEGAQQAVYSLRTLASDQHLSIAATRTDPQTGKLHTEHYEVYGPVVIVITTTAADAFDEETRSRFVQLTMDESEDQTRQVLEQQRRRYTLEGVLERAASEQVRKLHHNVQKLLRPLEVVNPYVEQLTYPTDRLIHRREQKKYLALINSIALLNQHQRRVRRAARESIEVEYVEVEIEDIALANELAQAVLARSLDELAPPVRGMYQAIRAVCEAESKARGCGPADVRLSRREIRELTGWSDWQVRTYCEQLVELEYLHATVSGNGKPALYQMARAEEERVLRLRGLTDIDGLKQQLKGQQLKKKAGGDAQQSVDSSTLRGRSTGWCRACDIAISHGWES
jgi:DNA primase